MDGVIRNEVRLGKREGDGSINGLMVVKSVDGLMKGKDA